MKKRFSFNRIMPVLFAITAVFCMCHCAGIPERSDEHATAPGKIDAPVDSTTDTTAQTVEATPDGPECHAISFNEFKRGRTSGAAKKTVKIRLPRVTMRKITARLEQTRPLAETSAKSGADSGKSTRANPEKKSEKASRQPAVARSVKQPESGGEERPRSGSAAADAAETVREVRANPGDDIEISFNRDGWIFLGFRNPDDAKGMTFEKRKTAVRETLFYFRAREAGIYDLAFVRQDNGNGTQATEDVRVFVEAAGTPGASDSDAVLSSATLTPEELYDAKRYKEALARYLQGYKDGSPFHNDRIAELSQKTGNIEQAIVFWNKNVPLSGDYARKAVVAIAAAYLQKNDREGLIKFVEQMIGIEGVPAARYVADIALVLDKRGENELGLSIVRTFVEGHGQENNLDQLYFLLGKFYEKEGQSRDLKKARMYYKKIYEEFPESFLVEAAIERVNYLDRYFFIIK